MKLNNASKVIALASVVSALGFSTSAFAGVAAPAKESKEVVKIEEKAEPFGLNVTLAYDSQYEFRGVNILGGGKGEGATEGGGLVSADINSRLFDAKYKSNRSPSLRVMRDERVNLSESVSRREVATASARGACGFRSR